MKAIATLILNRNLPDVTDALCEHLTKQDGDLTDIYVVEAGSDPDKLARHCTWWADWEEVRQHGLRTPRGFNYGLCRLWEEKKFQQYDAFFLLTNDTEFGHQPTLAILLEELARHPRLGILSPCSRRWGERFLLEKQPTRYFWYIHNTAYLVRRAFVESVMEPVTPTLMNFLYDGTNFRGYSTEMELIAKGYANDWAAGITNLVWSEENEKHLRTKADLIKTEDYGENMRLYLEEGTLWMRRKYGFNSRWSMQMYAKFFYEKFFEHFPEYKIYEI